MERAPLFAHERLDVYGIALKFATLANEFLCSWPSRWAVHDQLDRATESILTNLARAARLRASENEIYSIECSLGSVLESAACLDVAYRRHLVSLPQIQTAKQILQSIAQMEVGLRASWAKCVREESGPYGSDTSGYFSHESLDVYQRSLQVHESLNILWADDRNRNRYTKRIDALSTSLTINIAEGNGRFSKLDHSKFLGIAEDAGTKLGTCLDLAGITSGTKVEGSKSYLREVMAMLAGLRAYLTE